MKIIDFLLNNSAFDQTLTIPFDLRSKSRFKAVLDNGEEVSVVLPRGRLIQHDDRLVSESGLVIKIIAAEEKVSSCYTDDDLLLLRAAYHLGNRHVPLQITENFVRYLEDHVLDAMVENLGLKVLHEVKPFEPEAGAYSHH